MPPIKNLWIGLLLIFLSTRFSLAETITCPDPSAFSSGQEALDAYCIRCHKAPELANRYFSGAAPSDLAKREAELANFLNRHSSCPHRHHEEIAAWLRQIFGK